MRVVLPFKLVGQKLVKGREFPKSVADGSKDSVVIKVDGIPDGCIAKGYFKLSWENNTTYDLTFNGDELVVDEYIVTLPAHANNKYIDYKFSVSVAIWEGSVERLTTNPVEIVVEKSNYSDETTNTPDVPESQYEKLLGDVVTSIITDDEFSANSSNPLQNKVITKTINELVATQMPPPASDDNKGLFVRSNGSHWVGVDGELLPVPSEEDEGKTLKVVDGHWALEQNGGTTEIVIGKNKLNLDDVMYPANGIGYQLSSTKGTVVEVANGTNAVTGFIPVVVGETYVFQYFGSGAITGSVVPPIRLVAYDKDGGFVECKNDPAIYTVPEGVATVRFVAQSARLIADAKPMFFVGDGTPADYEPYTETEVTTGGITVNAEGVIGLTEFCTEVAEQVVEEATAELDERVAALEQNGGGVVEDGFVLKYVDGCYTNNNGVATLSNSATVAEAWECIVLDVSQNVGATLGIVTYTDRTRPILIADAGFNILGDPIAPNTGNPSLKFQTTATIPENATTLIINHYKGRPDVEVTGYMVDKYIRKDAVVQGPGNSETAVMSQKAVTELFEELGDKDTTKSLYSFRSVDAVCDHYSNEADMVDIPKGEGNRYIDPVNDIYALYDGLVAAYPGYVTRELMGEITPDMVQTPNTAAWQQSGEQLPALTETLPIYRYDFKPPMLMGSKTDDVSKILYCSGTHGGEISPVLQGYRFFKDLCENWQNQELLKSLRFNCHFTVIPIVNPYGIKFSRKTNERGVNLNRNFTKEWVYVEDDGTYKSPYGGEAPATELATRRIEEMTANERFDFGIDHHTFDSFVGLDASTYGRHIGYFCSNDVARPQDKSFADLAGIWISAKTVCNNTMVTDLSKSYCRTTAGTAFNGYLFSAFPAGYCFETIFSWGNTDEGKAMEAVYPCQKFGAEVLGGIFHTAMVSYHSY